jgi:hypothetical protein
VTMREDGTLRFLGRDKDLRHLRQLQASVPG